VTATKRISGFFRIAVLFAAILAMLGVSMASTSSAHIHARSGGGQCDLCVTAHVVSVEARAIFQFAGAVRVYERLTPGIAVAGYQLLLATSSLSRGPPSLT
jgi:hypothetical protein